MHCLFCKLRNLSSQKWEPISITPPALAFYSFETNSPPLNSRENLINSRWLLDAFLNWWVRYYLLLVCTNIMFTNLGGRFKCFLASCNECRELMRSSYFLDASTYCILILKLNYKSLSEFIIYFCFWSDDLFIWQCLILFEDLTFSFRNGFA